MSIKIVSGVAALATPSGPKTAASTILAELRLVMTKAAPRVASAGEAAGRAPLSASGRNFALSRSNAATFAPVSSSLAAIAPPMTPTPITAADGEELVISNHSRLQLQRQAVTPPST